MTSASDLKLYLVAFLATAYATSWWMFAGRAPAPSDEFLVVEAKREASGQAQMATWYDDLPPAERPVVELPAGWHVTERSAPPPSVTLPRPVRGSAARSGRIRTRSS